MFFDADVLRPILINTRCHLRSHLIYLILHFLYLFMISLSHSLSPSHITQPLSLSLSHHTLRPVFVTYFFGFDRLLQSVFVDTNIFCFILINTHRHLLSRSQFDHKLISYFYLFKPFFQYTCRRSLSISHFPFLISFQNTRHHTLSFSCLIYSFFFPFFKNSPPLALNLSFYFIFLFFFFKTLATTRSHSLILFILSLLPFSKHSLPLALTFSNT